MDLDRMIDATLAGSLPLAEVQRWVKANRDLYRKPPLREALQANLERGDIDRLVDEFSDWEIRMRKLGDHMLELQRQVFAGHSQQKMPALLLYLLSKLYDALLPQAQGAFSLGYVLWQAEEYYDAADTLAE